MSTCVGDGQCLVCVSGGRCPECAPENVLGDVHFVSRMGDVPSVRGMVCEHSFCPMTLETFSAGYPTPLRLADVQTVRAENSIPDLPVLSCPRELAGRQVDWWRGQPTVFSR